MPLKAREHNFPISQHGDAIIVARASPERSARLYERERNTRGDELTSYAAPEEPTPGCDFYGPSGVAVYRNTLPRDRDIC